MSMGLSGHGLDCFPQHSDAELGFLFFSPRVLWAQVRLPVFWGAFDSSEVRDVAGIQKHVCTLLLPSSCEGAAAGVSRSRGCGGGGGETCCFVGLYKVCSRTLRSGWRRNHLGLVCLRGLCCLGALRCSYRFRYGCSLHRIRAEGSERAPTQPSLD